MIVSRNTHARSEMGMNTFSSVNSIWKVVWANLEARAMLLRWACGRIVVVVSFWCHIVLFVQGLELMLSRVGEGLTCILRFGINSVAHYGDLI